MSSIKSVCKQYRTDPKECLNQLKSLKPTPSVVGQWAFYAASIGYHEVFRACWKSVEHAFNARRSAEHTKSGLLMNACVGGHPQIVDCVARAYAKDVNDAYKMVEHCAKSGKQDVLDVLLTVGEDLNIYAWKPARVIKECFKAHQNTMAMEYVNRFKDTVDPHFANDCCMMGNIEGLVVLHDFCKSQPDAKWVYTWRKGLEEACKNQRIEMMDFLLNDGLELFTQQPATETYFLGVSNAATWARNFLISNRSKAEEMFDIIFKSAPFEMWRHKVPEYSIGEMEQRYANYLRTAIQSNIDLVDTTSTRRKI